MNRYHITPENDTYKHDESQDCICDPKVEVINNNIVVIHNAFDRREIIEEFNEVLKCKTN